MRLPPDFVIDTLCSDSPEFKIIHFKDKNFKKTDPAHFYVVISLGDEKYMLVSIITSQMENLSRYYLKIDEEEALNSLVLISDEDFSALNKRCVINCNNTQLMSKNELLDIIDQDYEGIHNSNPISCVHWDYDFTTELKIKILDAIENSPIVKESAKESATTIKENLQPAF